MEKKLIKAGEYYKGKDSVRNLQRNTPYFNEEDYAEFSKSTFLFILAVILGSIGYSLNNTVYCIIVNLLKLCCFFGDTIYMVLVGERNTGKSALKDIIFTENIETFPEAPTIPALRGVAREKKKKKNATGDEEEEEEEIVPLEKRGIFIEEAANGNKTNLSDSVGFFKEIWGRKSFKKNAKKEVPTKTNITFTLNNYSVFKNLKAITRNTLLSGLPSIFSSDEAFYQRFFMILPHYKVTLGEIKYVDKEQMVIPIVSLEKLLISFQELKVDLDLEKYGITGRYDRNFSAVISLIGKIFFYNDIKENRAIPEMFIKGMIEFLRHFNSIAENMETYNPFNENSAILILTMLGFDIEKVEFVLFHEERILIKQENEDFFHKIALTGYGIDQNRKEMEFFKENPDKIVKIISLTEDGIRMKQEYANIYSSHVIKISPNFERKLTDDIYNKVILELIQQGGDVSNKEFRGIPEFFNRVANGIVKECFGNNTSIDVYKKNYVLINGNIKLLNFCEFISDEI